MIKVLFNYIDFLDADAFDKKMLEKRKNAKTACFKTSRPNYIGFLGERAFKKYLDYAAIKYHHVEIDECEWGDNYDFLIEGKHKIDVKASAKDMDMVINEKNVSKAKMNGVILVQVFIKEDDREALIVGRGNPHDFEFHKEITYNDQARRLHIITQDKIVPLKYDDGFLTIY